jgi:hypothetical protein
MPATRTTHRNSSDKAPFPEAEKLFESLQSYKRARAQDVKRRAKAAAKKSR